MPQVLCYTENTQGGLVYVSLMQIPSTDSLRKFLTDLTSDFLQDQCKTERISPITSLDFFKTICSVLGRHKRLQGKNWVLLLHCLLTPKYSCDACHKSISSSYVLYCEMGIIIVPVSWDSGTTKHTAYISSGSFSWFCSGNSTSFSFSACQNSLDRITPAQETAATSLLVCWSRFYFASRFLATGVVF